MVMQEIVEKVLEPDAETPDAAMSSPRSQSVKRAVSPDSAEAAGRISAPRLESSGCDGNTDRSTSVLSVEAVQKVSGELSDHHRAELIQMYDAGVPWEVMLVSYQQK